MYRKPGTAVARSDQGMVNPWISALMLLALLVLTLLPQMGHAACSAAPPSGYAGRISINEYNMIGSNTPTGNDYVELKVLDSTLLSDTTDLTNWKLRVYRNSAGASGGTTCSPTSRKCVYFDTNLGTILAAAVHDNSSNDYCQNTAGKDTYIRVPYAANILTKDSNVVLLDPSGNVVDLLRVTDANAQSSLPTWWNVESSCASVPLNTTTSGTWPFDTDIWNVDVNRKNIQRLPDGLGPWTQAPGNGSNSEDSLCTTNDNILLVTKIPLTTTYNSCSPGDGGTAQYLITVKNGAASASQNGIVVKETLPAGETYVPGGVAPTQGTVSATGTAPGSVITWSVGTLAAGASASWTLTVTTTTTSRIDNMVTATSTELAGGFTQATATINGLLLSIVPTPASVGLDENVTFTVAVKNQLAVAAPVQVSLPLPAGLSYVSKSGDGSLAPTSGTMIWDVGTLAAGDTAEMYLVLKATSTGSLSLGGSASTAATGSCGHTASGTVTVANPGDFIVDVPNFLSGAGVQGTITAPKSGIDPVNGFKNAVRKVRFYYAPLVPTTPTCTTTILKTPCTMKMDAYESPSQHDCSRTPPSSCNLLTSFEAADEREIYFDANGIGKFDINYDDVGKFTLYADWRTSFEAASVLPSLNGTPSPITGSDPFVVSPHQFEMVSKLSTGQVSDTIEGGSSFQITVTAQTYCKSGWDSYYFCVANEFTTAIDFMGVAASDVTIEMDGTGLNLAYNPPVFCSPESPTCMNGTTSAYVPAAAFLNGVATMSGAHWSEVGTVPLKASTDYLGVPNQNTSGETTHFYPARFSFSGSVTGANGSYIYFGQPGLDFAQVVRAEVTYLTEAGLEDYRAAQNYDSDRYDPAKIASVRSLSQVAGADLNAYVDNTYAAQFTNIGSPVCDKDDSWNAGECRFTTNDAVFQRDTAVPSAPKTVDFSVQLTDVENRVVDCLPTTACVSGSNVMTHPYGSLEARYGRLRMSPGQGSDKTGYILGLEAQYCTTVSGTVCTRWSTNGDDSYSTLVNANIGLTGVSVPSSSLASIKNGVGRITLGKPAGRGTLKVCLDLASTGDGCTTIAGGSHADLDYLRGNWGGSSTFTIDPSATIDFGKPGLRGYIYRR